MDDDNPVARLKNELNDAYARQGRYLAAWLEEFPEDAPVAAPEPDELVRRYRAALALREEAARLRDALEKRRALLERDEVQAALWIGRWRLWRWAPLRRPARGLLRAARNAARSFRGLAG